MIYLLPISAVATAKLQGEGSLTILKRQPDVVARDTAARSERARSKALTATALATLLAVGCSTGRGPAAGSPEQAIPMPVAVAQSAPVPDQIEAVGTVRAIQTADIASQIAGNILEVRVHEGDHVRADQLLAVIDDSIVRTAVDQAVAAEASAKQALDAAESDYALAASTLQRYQPLYEKQEISAQQFDEVKTRAQAALAHRDLARAQLSRTTAALAEARVSLGHSHVEAPFAGLVTRRQVDPGTFASVGLPLFTLEDTSRYRLEASVNESDMRSVQVGSHANVALDALGATELQGRVSQIVPSADPASRSFLVKIDLPADSRLRSGLFGRAGFSRGTRSALMIPKSAVVERGQMQAVFALDAGSIATLRYVTIGAAHGQQVEVLSGLESGERVVAAPGDRQLAGQRISSRP